MNISISRIALVVFAALILFSAGRDCSQAQNSQSQNGAYDPASFSANVLQTASPGSHHWPGVQYVGDSEPSWQRAVSVNPQPGTVIAQPRRQPSQFQTFAHPQQAQPFVSSPQIPMQITAPLPPQPAQFNNMYNGNPNALPVNVAHVGGTSVAGIPFVVVDNRPQTMGMSSPVPNPPGYGTQDMASHMTPQFPMQTVAQPVAAPAVHHFDRNAVAPVANPSMYSYQNTTAQPATTQPIVAASGTIFSPLLPQRSQQEPGGFSFHSDPLVIPDEPAQVQAAIPDFITPTDGYSIEQLQQMAMQSNPILGKKRREIEATHGTWLQVGLYKNPTIGFVGDDYADNSTQGKQGFSVQQEIIRGNKLGLARNVERWSIDIARKEWEIAQIKVANDVKAMAYDYMVATYLVEAHRALVKIAEDCVTFSESMVQIHELGKNDLLQNRILRNRAVVELAKAEQDEQEKWMQLVAMVGQPDLARRGITDALGHVRFDIAPEQIWQDLAIESPEVQLERLRRQKAHSAIAREKAEAVSDITVGGAVSYHVTDEAMVGDFTVNMPLRVFDRNQGNIRRAQAEAMAQACEVERVQLELRTRFSIEWNNYMKADMVMRHYETSILPDAKESINLALQGAKQGELTSLELLITQQTYIHSLIEYIDAVRDATVSSTYINGMLLKGGLDP